MMHTLTEVLNFGQEQEVLELLIGLTDIEPKFLHQQLAKAVGTML